MKTITIEHFQENIEKILDDVTDSNNQYTVEENGERVAVCISEKDYNRYLALIESNKDVKKDKNK